MGIKKLSALCVKVVKTSNNWAFTKMDNFKERVVKYNGRWYLPDEKGNIYPDREVEEVEGAKDITSLIEWRRDGGDVKFLEYSLNEHSRVLVVGGFKGDYVSKVYDKFKCKIYVFEPIDEYCKELFERFKGNERIKIYNKGWSDRGGLVGMVKSGDQSGQWAKGLAERVYVYEASDWVRRKGFEIDLAYINCEGGEYAIFDNLISNGLLGRFKNIQIQFHNLQGHDGLHRDLIRTELGKSHTERWCYPWVWESWERK